jgi:hypothetical protein
MLDAILVVAAIGLLALSLAFILACTAIEPADGEYVAGLPADRRS